MNRNEMSFVSLLGEGSSIRDGNLTVSSHLKISGTVLQNIDCGGKLVIAGSGRVLGNIKAEDLVIEGVFEGNAWIRNHITIKRNAYVTGYLSGERIKIEEGAHCQIDTRVDREASMRFNEAMLDAPSPEKFTIPEEVKPVRNGASKKKKSAESLNGKATLSAASSSEPMGKVQIDRFW